MASPHGLPSRLSAASWRGPSLFHSPGNHPASGPRRRGQDEPCTRPRQPMQGAYMLRRAAPLRGKEQVALAPTNGKQGHMRKEGRSHETTRQARRTHACACCMLLPRLCSLRITATNTRPRRITPRPAKALRPGPGCGSACQEKGTLERTLRGPAAALCAGILLALPACLWHRREAGAARNPLRPLPTQSAAQQRDPARSLHMQALA